MLGGERFGWGGGGATEGGGGGVGDVRAVQEQVFMEKARGLRGLSERLSDFLDTRPSGSSPMGPWASY